MFKKDEVIVLLGAGASVDAGIPHSMEMVRRIEEALRTPQDWGKFKQLYDYVRSAIYFADGIRGRFDTGVPYNIERLVEALDELRRRIDHPLYPFIGAWNPRLIQVAGADFEEVDHFRERIVERLRRDWIEKENYEDARYYEGLLRFQSELNHPLRVFTLNYDLCVERISQQIAGERPECGFDEQRLWKWQLFEDSDGETRRIFLYKLHGSIDWKYDSTHAKLTFSDSTSKIEANETALIFGTSYKLQYIDPFLFLVYEFRRLSLEAKLLVLIGYGFGDEHINGILGQALRNRPEKRVVVVGPVPGLAKDEKSVELREALIEEWKNLIKTKLELGEEDLQSVHVLDSPAQRFFETSFTLNDMENLFPAEASPFPDFQSVNDDPETKT
jgi:hypothetical protein